MATACVSEVIQQLRKTALGDGSGRTDGELLEAFAGRRDAGALAALVQRHGAMVWGVCQRVLRCHHDVEDAFQATFLVFVRKAATIRHKEMVGNWLYGVAHQTAIRARALAARRGVRERQVAQMPEPGVGGEETWNDLQPLVDEELSRLPDKYRTLVVLCDLEGRTRKEAARQLGCPEGTVAGRLARARTMLAKRLARRGLALSGGAVATLLARGAAAASAPAQVVSSTIAAATHFAAGPAATGMISPVVAALTEGVLKGMLLTKLKLAGAAFLALVLVAGGTGMLIGQSGAAPVPAVLPKKDVDKSVPGTPGVSEKDRASAAEKKPADDPAEELRKAQEELRKAQEDLMRAQRKVHEAMRKMIESRIPGGGLGGGFGGAFPGGGFGGGGFGGFGPAAGARLGISVSKPAAALAEQLNLPEGQGLVLESVSAGSAGAKAGLKKNDILLELGGKKITNDVSALVKALDGFKTGDKVDAVILRMGKKETVKDLVMPEAPKGGFGGFGFTFPELPPPVRVVPEERKE